MSPVVLDDSASGEWMMKHNCQKWVERDYGGVHLSFNCLAFAETNALLSYISFLFVW